MIKARNKKISMLLVVAMLMTMFAFVGSATAATDNVALTIPTVGSSGSGITLGTLKIVETSNTIGSITGTAANPQQVTINLPSGVAYDAAPTAATLASYVAPDGTYLAAGDISFVAGSTKSLTISIDNRTDPSDKASLNFLFNAAGASTVTLDAPDADVAVEVYAPNSGITQGKVIVAESASAGTTTTVMEEKTVAVGTNKPVGTIRIAETRANAIKAGDQIKVVAPDDITIVSAYTDCTVANWLPFNAAAPVPGTAGVAGTHGFNFGVGLNPDGYSQLTLTCVTPTAAGTTPGFMNLVLVVDVDDRNFTGPIDFTVKGDNVTTQKIGVGKVADYSIDVVAAGDAKAVKAGFSGQVLQDLEIKEGLADSFVNNRDFILELPSYAYWQAIPTVTRDKGNGTFTPDQAVACTLDNQRHQLTFSYTAAASPTKSEFTFEDLKIFLDPDAPEGDLIVTADGKAIGGSYEVVLGDVVKPVTAEASKTDVKIGLANQKAADITITETDAGMLKYQVTEIAANFDKTALTTFTNQNAELILDLPDGVKFSKNPTVEVTEGNLKLKEYDISLRNNNNQLVIPINKTSDEASTIVISDIEYTLDRTVPEGDVKVLLTGNAVDQTLPADEAVVVVANATTVTPAPGDYKNKVVFTIDSSTYKVNDVEYTMDVAPYIKGDRTYMPVRYVANAIGISDSNIFWDPVKKSVTLMKGDKVVQLTIGSNQLLVNGAAITMDVAPEIVSDRTMLPARWVAQAFGASVLWDEATREVTIE